MNNNRDKKENVIQTLFSEVKDNNDQAALKQLFNIYFLRLNDFAAKIINDDIISQDIVQDVFVKFWEVKSEIKEKNIEAFLFRMVRNKCLDYIRHIKVVENFQYNYKNKAKYEELYRIDFIGDEPYVLIEKELRDEIEKTIQSLPDRCKEVFLLSRVKGLKNKEIAEKLGINIKNVERHISRALTVFKAKFSDKVPIALIVLIARHLKL